MNEQDFIFQLGKLKVNFILDIKDRGVKPDFDTFGISICDGYLSMRIECEDKYGDVVALKQSIYQDGETGKLYTGKIHHLC